MQEPDSISPGFKPVRFESLDWEEQATLMWSWFWRAFLINMATIWMAGLSGTFVGGLIRAVAGPLDPIVAQSIGIIIGAMIGFFAIHPLIKLLTMRRIGDYQMVILKRSPSST